ncbi:RNA-binding post-transcriptional regulator cip2 [Coniochaeta hoffmannii]|uniref:RNA-binding post-transcriptional regulator cip2 n=1 Tax=Coniochaeta hoffmannii TaxID=91930 RepID=A0AA38VRT0_9PEZI|nr:RNA-binding post-transcriptional regulator cip2 [Coniochaeta hoffmannii]
MNPQQDLFYGGGYPMGNANRSPSLSRPGYGTLSSLQPPSRGGQRQVESGGQNLPSLYGEDRFNSYDAAFRTTRLHPGQGFPEPFMLNNNNNNQGWGGFHPGAATVNGAMGGDGNRLRPSNRRGQIPSEWTSLPEQPLNNQSLHHGTPAYPNPPMIAPNLGMMNGGMPGDRHLYQNNYGSMPLRALEEKNNGSDLIPTAIVIKNIPFNIRKETLTQMMTDMALPQPYAFNYHFDQGVFRGLAFANFQNAEDTAIVIEKMNGLDVQGRKLRVEYKKMLPEHERERIEREKREKRGQLEEQHRPLALHPQGSMHSLTNSATTNGQRNSPLRDVDLNDPQTLSFYTELTLFRNDPDREILIFPNSITPVQRRTIHVLAHNMGLEHRSAGEGQHRQLHVIKNDNARVSPTAQAPPHLPAGVSLDAHRRGLSRAATIDFGESRMSNAGNYHAVGRPGNPMLELPGSPDVSGINGLRGVKSFADLRSYTPSPSPSVTGYGQANGEPGGHVARFGDYTQTSSLATPTTPGGGSLAAPSASDPSSLLLGMSGLGLGGFDGGSAQLRPREAPGAIGSQRPGMNGSNTRVNAPERQPRGPAEWESSGFGARGRSNGHMQRGSDSSDNAPRAGANAGTSRFH